MLHQQSMKSSMLKAILTSFIRTLGQVPMELDFIKKSKYVTMESIIQCCHLTRTKL